MPVRGAYKCCKDLRRVSIKSAQRRSPEPETHIIQQNDLGSRVNGACKRYSRLRRVSFRDLDLAQRERTFCPPLQWAMPQRSSATREEKAYLRVKPFSPTSVISPCGISARSGLKAQAKRSTISFPPRTKTSKTDRQERGCRKPRRIRS